MLHSQLNEGVDMEAIMIVGIAVVAVGGWYSAVDLLADMGIRVGSRSGGSVNNGCFSSEGLVPVQRRIKQMAGVNI